MMGNTSIMWRSMSDGAILSTIGDYIKEQRLAINKNQTQVAEKAGIPKSITNAARKILSRLESDNTLLQQPTLFGNVPGKERIIEVIKPSMIEKRLTEKNLNACTPKEALDFLYELQGLIEKN